MYSLQSFKRPVVDSGMGIHLAPNSGTKEAGLEYWLDRVQEMRFSWVTTLNDDADSMQRFARRGLGVVCRPFLRATEEWGDRGRVADDMRAAGLGPYVQAYNEPSDDREWDGGAPNIGAWIWRWIFAANNIINHGGYPGIQCLDPDELRQVLRAIKDTHQEYIFDKMWMSAHNYPDNHPPMFPADGLNTYTVYDKPGHLSMLVPLAFNRVFEEEIGHSVPVLCTEGGWCIGDGADARYPTLAVKNAEGNPIQRGYELHRDYTVATLNQFRLGKLVTGDPLPDWWFANMPWLIASQGISDHWVGGDTAFEENAWYSDNLSGTKTLTIEAIKAIPPFVRKFTWDGAPTPTPIPEPEVTPMPPEFVFGFKALHDANLDIVGAATSQQVDVIPNLFSVQMTEKGLLVYIAGSPAKFFKQTLPPV